MFKPTKENYLKQRGDKVKLGGKVVMVACHRTKSRGGSWERGFRFYETVWAKLIDNKNRASFDHGKTWHDSSKAGFKVTTGKMKLLSTNHGELAFHGIQEINRKWEPGFVWTR